MDDDVMSSLGKVLSSVNLVGEDTGMYGGPSNGHGNVNQQHGQQQHGGQQYGSNSWSGVALPSSGGTQSSG
jgi:hypothetical protein